MSNTNRASLRAVSLIAVLFILGIALGAVGEHVWNARMNDPHRRPHVVQQLKDELGLSPDQAKQFDAIIADQRSKSNNLRAEERSEWAPKYHALDAQRDAEWNPKMDQARQQGRDQIRAILTPEQRVKFDAFVRKLHEERQKSQQDEQQQQRH